MHDLTQVFLMVTDLERTVEFYTTALGFNLREQGDRSATFETGQCELHVEVEFDEATLAEFGLTPPEGQRGDGAILVVTVDDIDATYEQVTAAGAETLTEPKEVPWGRELFLVRDPDGYVLEISRPLED